MRLRIPMRLIQIARRKAVDALFNESFSNSWKYVFLPRIRKILGEKPRVDDLVTLGENLSSIFTNSNVNNQTNQVKAIGGSHWESLCIWYLNLLSYGTRTIAVPRGANKSLIPVEIQEGLSAFHKGELVRKQTDPYLISIPITKQIPEFNIGLKDNQIIGEYQKYIARNCESIRFTLLCCKTNCSDIIKEPMLWNFIYQKEFASPVIEIGNDKWNPSKLGYLSTAFVTIPVGNIQRWKRSHAQCVRARTFSGGSYWGRPGNEDLGFGNLSSIFNEKTMLASRENIGEKAISDFGNNDFKELFRL